VKKSFVGVILNAAKDLAVAVIDGKERFFAPLRMTTWAFFTQSI